MVPANQQNDWIFVANETLTIDIICGNQVFSQLLQGSGIIEFHDRCLIERPDLIIQSIKPLSTNCSISFVPPVNLTTMLEKEGQRVRIKNISYEKTNLNELDEQIKKLEKAVDESPSNFSTHDIHHYLSPYILIAISALIYYAYNYNHIVLRVRRRKTADDQNSQNTENELAQQTATQA